MSEEPIVVGPGEGCALWHGDALWEFRVRSEETGNRLWLAELTAARGWASPVHLHSREDEVFVVLDGELWVQVDGTEYVVPTGGTAYLPVGRPHAYRVDSERARFLAIGTPGGFDGWIEETGRTAEQRTLPPPATEEPDWPAYVAVLASYGVQFIAPPPVPVGAGSAAGREVAGR
jgi:quercetin dioxygenase-like cupin family protein